MEFKSLTFHTFVLTFALQRYCFFLTYTKNLKKKFFFVKIVSKIGYIPHSRMTV